MTSSALSSLMFPLRMAQTVARSPWHSKSATMKSMISSRLTLQVSSASL